MNGAPVLRPRGQSLAFVVFADSDLGYLRMLKPRFRHCMIIVGDGGEWILLDPLSNGLQVTRMGALPPNDLMEIMRESGLTAVPVQRAAPYRRELPWAPFTCVETVKRTLALRGRFVVTPWQLYRRISRRAGAERDDGRRRTVSNR